jgi:antitoxin CcdA
MPDKRQRFATFGPARATDAGLDGRMPEQAKALGITLSRDRGRALGDRIDKPNDERWLEENREALESSNAYVEALGLPLAKHRPYTNDTK